MFPFTPYSSECPSDRTRNGDQYVEMLRLCGSGKTHRQNLRPMRSSYRCVVSGHDAVERKQTRDSAWLRAVESPTNARCACLG